MRSVKMFNKISLYYQFKRHHCGMVYLANLIVEPLNVTLGVILYTWLFLLDLLIWAFSYRCSLSSLPSVINTVLCSSYPVLNLSTWCFSLKCLNSWENHVSHFHASCFWCWVFKETGAEHPAGRDSSELRPPRHPKY